MFLGLPFAGCLAQLAAVAACSACQCFSREALSHSARVAWSALFFLAMVVAWLMRDFGRPLLEKIPWIISHASGIELSDKWFGQQAVFRISMGNFLFFSAMSLALLGVKYKGDKRDQNLHHGNWLLKLVLWVLFSAFPFLLSNEVVAYYGVVARLGSGIFLVIQMVIVLDFVQCWNESWVANGESDQRWLYALLAITVTAYTIILTMIGLMFHWFKPSDAGSCSFNISMVTLTLMLALVLTVLSLHPSSARGGGSIFPAACVSLYATYLCFSALESEPKEYACNGLGHKISLASGSTLALGMMATLASVVYAAFRAGSNTHLFSLDGSEPDVDAHDGSKTALLAEEGAMTSAGLDGVPEAQAATRTGQVPAAMAEFAPVTYNYSFFHLIFALASMYIAMLMTGWGSVAQEKDRIDIGWSSVAVKLSAELVAASLYCWTLLAPALFPDRDFS